MISAVVNVVGARAVFGVIVPSTNTVVEHDYWHAGIEGVAFELFDATHDGIEYRYPLSLAYLAERLSPEA